MENKTGLTVQVRHERSRSGDNDFTLYGDDFQEWWEKVKDYRWHPAKGLYFLPEEVKNEQEPNIIGRRTWAANNNKRGNYCEHYVSVAGGRKNWGRWKREFHGME